MARVRRESVRGPSSFCVHFLGEPGVALSLALSTLAPRPRLPPAPGTCLRCCSHWRRGPACLPRCSRRPNG